MRPVIAALIGLLAVPIAAALGAVEIPDADLGVPWTGMAVFAAVAALGTLISPTIRGWVAVGIGLALGTGLGIWASGPYTSDLVRNQAWLEARQEFTRGVWITLLGDTLAAMTAFAIVALAVRRRVGPLSTSAAAAAALPVLLIGAIAMGHAALIAPDRLPPERWQDLAIRIHPDLRVEFVPDRLVEGVTRVTYHVDGAPTGPYLLGYVELSGPDDLERVTSSGGQGLGTVTATQVQADPQGAYRWTLSPGWYAWFVSMDEQSPPADASRYAVVHVGP
jgi:hypothetical protein